MKSWGLGSEKFKIAHRLQTERMTAYDMSDPNFLYKMLAFVF